MKTTESTPAVKVRFKSEDVDIIDVRAACSGRSRSEFVRDATLRALYPARTEEKVTT